MKTRIFHRNNLNYQDKLASVWEELFRFWQEEDAHFPRQKTVLVKPNLLSPHAPEAAITTHPAVVEGVVRGLQEWGNRVLIADSPAGIYNNNMKNLWRVTGMQEVSQQTGATLVDINRLPLKSRKGGERNFYFTALLEEVDYLVNLPKLKTHGLTLLTGAVKNVFGLIPGIQKGEFHIRYPDPEDFSANMVEIFQAVRPQFTIMDGIRILEGDGPSSGGSPRDAGFLLAGTDAVALDSVASLLIGIDPLQVFTTRIAHEKGVGQGDVQHIEVVGDEPAPIQARIPGRHIFSRLPDFLLKILSRLVWTRPRANPEKCSHCGICINNCPAEAMASDARGVPVIDYGKCINCFCCAEVCPDDAIYQEASWLVRRLS